MNNVTGLISTTFNAFKLEVELSFASDERKSIGSSTGVTESKVLLLFCSIGSLRCDFYKEGTVSVFC